MTSVFEVAEARRGGETHEELLTQSGRGVSLLEFFVVSERGHGAEEDAGGTVDDAEFVAGERARQVRAMVDAAREEAAVETRRGMELEMDARLEEERARVDQVCGQFARDRERYFGAAEAQVVKLALAMARRVLAREVAGDPMHLTATVRAALGRVQDGSATALRVPEEEMDLWAEMFAGGGMKVIGDDGLRAGECVLETNVGRVELGVEVQMAEIERGFGELLHRQGE